MEERWSFETSVRDKELTDWSKANRVFHDLHSAADAACKWMEVNAENGLLVSVRLIKL